MKKRLKYHTNKKKIKKKKKETARDEPCRTMKGIDVEIGAEIAMMRTATTSFSIVAAIPPPNFSRFFAVLLELRALFSFFFLDLYLFFIYWRSS